MPIEFPHGRPLSPEELELIRRQVEEGFEVIAAVDGEIRGITPVSVVGCVVARDWPHEASTKRTTQDPTASSVTIRERILLFSVAKPHQRGPSWPPPLGLRAWNAPHKDQKAVDE